MAWAGIAMDAHLLAAGKFAHDANLETLQRALAEWTDSRELAAVLALLGDPGEDGDLDRLNGGRGDDELIAGPGDALDD